MAANGIGTVGAGVDDILAGRDTEWDATAAQPASDIEKGVENVYFGNILA